MQILFLIIEFALIFGAVNYTSRIKFSTRRILTYVITVICPTTIIFLLGGKWQGIIFLIVISFVYFYWLSKKFLMLIHICFIVNIGIVIDNITQYIMSILPFHLVPEILEQYCIFIILGVYNQYHYLSAGNGKGLFTVW